MKTLEARLLERLENELNLTTEDLAADRKKITDTIINDADYCARWYIEPVIKSEHKFRLLYKLVKNLQGIVSGDSNIKMLAEEFVDQNIDQLKGEIMRGYFINKSTCAMTVQTGVFKQEAQCQYVERIENILSYCLKEQKEIDKTLNS